jgi:DNA-binding NarL/FixJ family response regulator
MKRKKNGSLIPSNVPVEVKAIATAIADGRVKNAKMEWKSDGSIVFSADSPDGQARILMEKVQFAGILEESKVSISKPRDREERLQRVAVLRKRGMTQMEISQRTITSQKTVSNDIKQLIKRGDLDE